MVIEMDGAVRRGDIGAVDMFGEGDGEANRFNGGFGTARYPSLTSALDIHTGIPLRIGYVGLDPDGDLSTHELDAVGHELEYAIGRDEGDNLIVLPL